MFNIRNFAVLFSVAILSLTVVWVVCSVLIPNNLIENLQTERNDALLMGVTGHVEALEQWQADFAPMKREIVVQLLHDRVFYIYRNLGNCISVLTNSQVESLKRANSFLKNWYRLSNNNDDLRTVTVLEERYQCDVPR